MYITGEERIECIKKLLCFDQLNRDEYEHVERQYRFPPVPKEELTKQFDELLKNRIIKPSQSPYNTPVWIVPEKPDSTGNI